MTETKKFYVNLVSNYPSYKMLTPKKKIEFLDGVARVEFDSEAEAARVASEAKASEVAKANIAAQAATGIKVGAQTSEMPKPAVAQVAIKAAPTSAQVFAKEEAKSDVQ